METTYAPGSLEAECPGGLDWAWYGLGECIRSTTDKISIAFGVMSIISWVLFGLPQIVENCRSKIPDAAVSVFLLLFWIVGDSLNFIGCFLTGQLFLQIFLAGYTVCIDCVLFGQYLYYKYRNKHKKQLDLEEFFDDDEKVETSEKSEPKPTKGKALATVLLGAAGISFISINCSTSTNQSLIHGSRRLFQAQSTDPFANFLPTVGEKVGYVFGWISFFMYAAGRTHQIYLNWHRKTTEGLSVYLFVLAVLGNTFYSCQIFVKSTDPVFIVNSLPWILGSLGMLLFDSVIFTQFFRYRHNKSPEQDNDHESMSAVDEESYMKGF